MAPNKPLVTIAIPTFNRGGSYLRETISSALRQTHESLEIIISDNCSPDDTAGIVGSFSDDRIRYHRHSVNVGANGNANFCLQQARGTYFLLLHDDDLIDPDFVECCVVEAQKSPDAAVIRTGARVIDRAGAVVSRSPNMARGLSTDEFFLAYLQGRTSFYYCSTLFHAQRLREIGGLHSAHNLVDDGVAIAKLASAYGRGDIPEIKASFRQHEGKLGRAASVAAWCDDSLMLLRLMEDLAPRSRAILRREGMRFLAGLNYRRAMRISSPVERVIAQFIVYKAFGFRRLPPIIEKRLVVRGVRRLIRLLRLRAAWS